ncbi:MAG: hypothetical protein GF398_17470 [Chitinivibrionales bacterium]|nr:hypothetical protein [Chitinivibrionales bacterium]
MTAIPIAGMGAISAAGSTAGAGYPAVEKGSDNLRPLQSFQSGLKEQPLCAEIPPEVTLPDAPNRTAALSATVLEQALQPLADRSRLRVSLTFATTVAGMTRSEVFYRACLRDAAFLQKAGEELACHEPTAIAGYLAHKFGCHSFYSLSTACSTGLHAIGMAKRLIEAGVCDACVALGADALSMLTVRGFAGLLLVDPGGARPFDKKRAGISLGEGAGALLLIHPDILSSYGLQAYAWVEGWGASADCHHMTAPHPEGTGARRAVESAVKQAGIEPARIDYIASHGTGTPDNDAAEIRAMHSIFDELPPFGSMKRTIGHTLAASGALESVYAVGAMQAGMIPATGGFDEPDESIGAAPSPMQKRNINYLLKNSFGFGGNNAAVIFSNGENESAAK